MSSRVHFEKAPTVIPTNNIVGTGTENKVAKFTAAQTIASSLLTDDGSSVYNTGAGNITSNVAFGLNALTSNTSGGNNVAIGFQSLNSNTTGAFNTAVGTNSLQNNTESFNTAFGAYTLNSNTTGTNNVAVGINSLRLNVSGINNTAIGRESLYSNTASSNVAIGYQSSYNNTTAANNTSVGYRSAYSNITGTNNVAIGLQALYSNTTGSSNTAVGIDTDSGNFNSSVILGRLATATADNQFVVGSSSYNAGSVVTAAQTQTRYWEVVINGVVERILLA